MKYSVKIGNKPAQIFDTYAEAIAYMKKNWIPFTAVEFLKIKGRMVVFGY